MECGGLWLTSDFQGEHEGKPFHGKGLDSYDAGKKKYAGSGSIRWLTTPALHGRDYDDESSQNDHDLPGECPGPDGKPMKMKMVTKEIDDDHDDLRDVYGGGGRQGSQDADHCVHAAEEVGVAKG